MFNKKVKEHFGYETMPDLEELEMKTKLMLINSDNSIDYPEPLQPNMIQVGGLQIAEPKPLEGKLKEFIENSEKGTVLMSLGTNIKSNMLGTKVLTEIIQTFADIPQYNFVWKFESELEDLPIKITKNVMISKFLPQNDILAHPKVKAFITHAGGLSTHEALWYGKPMVAIPFLVDQHRTAKKSVLLGVAVKINYKEITSKNLKAAILEILKNPKYEQTGKKISKVFQDKPMKPLDTAIWWIEHVIRNPDAPIYDPVALKQGFLISNSYDVLLVLLILIFTITFIVIRIFKVVIRFLVRSKKSDKIKRN
jgi:glucuronosyltransferase